MNNWIGQIIVLLLLSTALAVGINAVRCDGINFIGNWPSRTSSDGEPLKPPSADEGDPPFITLDDAAMMFQNPDIVFIDARDPEDYAYGHIAKSINIPFDYLDEQWEEYIDSLGRSLRYVIYCSGGECESSLFLGRYFYELGFTDIKIFFGGWEEWKLHNLPRTSGDHSGEEIES